MQYFWNNWELFCEGVLFEWVGAEGSEQRPGSPACDFFSLRSFLKTKLNIFPKPSLHWGGSNGAVKEEEEEDEETHEDEKEWQAEEEVDKEEEEFE